jgi:hypothetical protein
MSNTGYAMKSKKVSKVKKAPPVQKKLIDVLHQALVKAGYNVERGGWDEIGTNDPCEWLDVKSDMVANKKTVIHFYFTNNATDLEDVKVYETEYQLEEGDTNEIFKFKNAAAIRYEKEQEKRTIKAEEARKKAPRGYSVNTNYYATFVAHAVNANSKIQK